MAAMTGDSHTLWPGPIRAARAPHIDGRDDDAVWRNTQPITDFRQFEPVEDGDPSFATEARLAYDSHNLYIMVRSHDPHPDSLLSVLERRDGGTFSDEIVVGIDSYHDRRSAYMFRLTPAGTMSDGYMFNDGVEDWDWNAVWEGAAEADSLGWTAELRIPLSQLRYVPGESNTLGVMILRTIARKGERITWPVMRKTGSGTVSQFAAVPGFVGLSAPRRIELMPYSMMKYGTSLRGDGTPDNAVAAQVGANIKFGITPNITLDATVNPDFGQVEADPGVLNLTAFEQFYPEKRPFFLEGSGIFRYDLNCEDGACSGLFYSRRIGRAPQLLNSNGDAASPQQTRILGAAKATGRLGNGLSVGILDAVTSHEDGASRRTIEPQTNYAVMRLQQDLRGGNSGVGLMLTSVNRKADAWTSEILRNSALTGGMDVRHRFARNRWQVSAQLAGSYVSGSSPSITRTQLSAVHQYQRVDASHLNLDSTRTSLSGFTARVALDKQGGGILRTSLVVKYTDPGFEINDIGYMPRADELVASGWVGLQPVRPVGIFRRANLNFNAWGSANSAGMITGNGVNGNGWGQLDSFWTTNGGVMIDNALRAWSDRESRSGPAIFRPPRISMWGGVGGDNRGAVVPNVSVSGGRRLDGLGSNWNVSTGISARAGHRFNGKVSLEYGRSIDDQQWNGNFMIDDKNEYTFARLYQSTGSITARLNYTLTPMLSIESYVQPFVASGTFTDWRALVDGRSADRDKRFRAFSSKGAPGGFQIAQLRTSNVVRWEYRPGSTLFLVWTQGRDDTGAENMGVWHGYSDVFSRRPVNIFLVKASYWFGR